MHEQLYLSSMLQTNRTNLCSSIIDGQNRDGLSSIQLSSTGTHNNQGITGTITEYRNVLHGRTKVSSSNIHPLRHSWPLIIKTKRRVVLACVRGAHKEKRVVRATAGDEGEEEERVRGFWSAQRSWLPLPRPPLFDV
jgi:hypothetical protein